MGYNSSATSLTLTAKLTPFGRQKILTNSIGVISKFSLGDSDANYNIEYPLLTGYIPATGGNIGPDSGTTNSTYNNMGLRSFLYYDNASNNQYKLVELNSAAVSVSTEMVGMTVVSGSNLVHTLIDKTNTSDAMGNLFFTCGLPITDSDKLYFSGYTYSNGGFKDTAISGLSQDKALIIALNNSTYGELIDGKTINLSITTTAATYNLYGTYRSGVYTSKELDALYRESTKETAVIGNNITFLFSDSIKKPNGDTSKSWSTGWNTYKPFSLNTKEQFNYTTINSVSKTADTACAVAYLDKGLIAITDPTIVNNFSFTGTGATVVQFNSVVTRISQDITCIVGRGEFGRSSNKTWGAGIIPRISEVTLYDREGNILAIAKTDRQIEVPASSFMALTVKIVV